MEMNLREVVVRQMSEMKNNLLGMEGDQENFWPVSSGDFLFLCVCVEESEGKIWEMMDLQSGVWLYCWLVSQLNMRGAVEFNHILVRLKLSFNFLFDRIQ